MAMRQVGARLPRCDRLPTYSIVTRALLTQANPPDAARISLVQGASRGLGLEFVKQLLQRPGQVIATCRTPQNASELQRLQQGSAGRLSVVQLDTTDEASIQRAADQVAGTHAHLDLLLNVSGVLHIPGLLSPETSVTRVTLDNLLTTFATNAFGPILVAKAFSPLLINAAKLSAASAERPAVLANLSARVGSIGDNRLGGWYSYRASKAALNQLTKCLSLELARKRQNVACVLLHPGTADTDLSVPFQRNVAPEKLFTKERTVRQLLDIVDRTTMEDSGGYFAWDSTTIPW